MKRQIGFRYEEDIEKEKITVEEDNNVYNGWGGIWQKVPPTFHEEMKYTLKNFNPKKIAQLFIDIGTELMKEPNKITNLELKSQFKEKMDFMGKEFGVIFEYDTVDERL